GEGAGCSCRDSTIHQQGLSGDIGTGVRGKKDYRAIKITRCSRAFQGNPVAEVIHPFLVFVHDCVLSGLEPARSKTIYGDTMDAQSSARLIVSCFTPPRLAP